MLIEQRRLMTATAMGLIDLLTFSEQA